VSVRVAKVSFRHNSNGRNGDSGVGYEEPSDLIITDGTVLFKLHLKKNNFDSKTSMGSRKSLKLCHIYIRSRCLICRDTSFFGSRSCILQIMIKVFSAIIWPNLFIFNNTKRSGGP
jgi:hypothetical protein